METIHVNQKLLQQLLITLDFFRKLCFFLLRAIIFKSIRDVSCYIAILLSVLTFLETLQVWSIYFSTDGIRFF